MLVSVSDVREQHEWILRHERVLVIDTCGDTAGVAVNAGASLAAQEVLERGKSSTEIVAALERVLQSAGVALGELNAVGVVSGPGAFTGVRVGLAAAKGLCEATGARMIAVSRLAVLAEAAGLVGAQAGWAALDAGRGEFYLGERSGDGVTREWLADEETLRSAVAGGTVHVAEARVVERLAGVATELRPLTVADALAPLLRILRGSTTDMILAEANYLRRESEMYGKR